MANTFQMDVVDSHHKIFSGEITEVTTPGTMGYLTIMAGHTQLITSLKAGELNYTLADGSNDVLFISGGILEVQPHVVTILADTILRSDELDAKAAQEAIDRANEKIARSPINSKEHQQLEREIQIMKALIKMSRTTNKLRIKRY